MTSSTTRCVEPATVTKDDLVAFARGDAGPIATAHIERCPSCMSHARFYRHADQVLLTALFRRGCPPALTLGEYAIDLLPAEQRRTVAEHLVDCPHCLAESREVRNFMKQPDVVDQRVGPFERLRRVLATPLMLPTGAPIRLRGDQDGKNLTYIADGVRLTVSIQEGGRGAVGHVLVGLVEHDSNQATPLEMRAALYRDDILVQTENVDDLGNFIFAHVPAGPYRIEVTVPSATVYIEGIDVP